MGKLRRRVELQIPEDELKQIVIEHVKQKAIDMFGPGNYSISFSPIIDIQQCHDGVGVQSWTETKVRIFFDDLPGKEGKLI